MGSKRRGFLLAVLVAIFLAGLSVLLYPAAHGAMTQWRMKGKAEEFLSFVQTDSYMPGDNSSCSSPNEEHQEQVDNSGQVMPDKYPELWLDMQAYNKGLYESGQAGLSNPSAYEEPSFNLADYEIPEEVFGVLSIPKLDVELPLYLGATGGHMADGAAHMTQTSLPIGGENTNCVIAGHRGWKGAAYFLYLPQLEQGEIVQVTNLWETLTYKVVETKIIYPDEVEAIHIQPGRELLTLLTCHPPASGGKQRYLVFCERIQTEMEDIT